MWTNHAERQQTVKYAFNDYFKKLLTFFLFYTHYNVDKTVYNCNN